MGSALVTRNDQRFCEPGGQLCGIRMVATGGKTAGPSALSWEAGHLAAGWIQSTTIVASCWLDEWVGRRGGQQRLRWPPPSPPPLGGSPRSSPSPLPPPRVQPGRPLPRLPPSPSPPPPARRRRPAAIAAAAAPRPSARPPLPAAITCSIAVTTAAPRRLPLHRRPNPAAAVSAAKAAVALPPAAHHSRRSAAGRPPALHTTWPAPPALSVSSSVLHARLVVPQMSR